MFFQIPCMQTELDRTLDQLLSDYFTKGFTYLEIQEFLRVYHQQTIGLSTIKRHLKKPIQAPCRENSNWWCNITGCCKGRIKWQWIQDWMQESLGSLAKNGLKIPTRQCSPGYFAVRSGGSVKKKTKKTETEKILQCWTKLLLAYWWPWRAKVVWFFIAWMHRWLFEQTNMAWSIIL